MPRSGVRSEAMSDARRKEWRGKARKRSRDVDNSRKLQLDQTVSDLATRRMTGQGREVWHRVVIEGVSQEEVAREFGISQAAVSLHCKAVRDSIPQPVLDDFVRDELAQLKALQQPFIAIVLDENQSVSVKAKAYKEIDRNKNTSYELLGVKRITVQAIVSNREITTYEFLEEGRKLPDDDPQVVEWREKMERLNGTPLAIQGEVER